MDVEINGSNTTSSPKDASTTAAAAGLNKDGTIHEIFLYIVLLIGLVGCCANGVVLAAFSDKKLRQKSSNSLIIWQVLFDMLACICLVLAYFVDLSSGSATYAVSTPWSRFLCICISGNGIPAVAQNASVGCLVIVAFERYFKIAHSLAYRKMFKRWMVDVAIVFNIIQNLLINALYLFTSDVIGGQCQALMIWPSQAALHGYIIFDYFCLFALPLMLFIFIYGLIIISVRKQASTVMAASQSERSAAPSGKSRANHKSRRMNLIKTMVIVSMTFLVTSLPSAFFGVCWSYGYIFTVDNNLMLYNSIFMTIFYVNICLNPFIYACSLDEVRHQVGVMIRRVRSKFPRATTKTIAPMIVVSING